MRQGGVRLETFRALRRMFTGESELESGASGGSRPAEPSAAQNGTVIQTCRHCGAIHGANATSCDVCRAHLPTHQHARGVRANGPGRTAGALAVAPDWRSEVSLRLQEYRKRQQRLREGPTQPELAFVQEESAEADKPVWERAPYGNAVVAAPVPPVTQRVSAASESAAASIKRPGGAATRARFSEQVAAPPARVARTRYERVEIDLRQPSLDFSGATSSDASRGGGWHVALVSPMASLHERRMAAALDAGLLLFAYGSFLTLFWALGGRLVASRTDAAVLTATLGLFYAQYFALFTLFGGNTPGMMWRGLRLATFDGREPQVWDKVWRSFGYLVSAGTLGLGFLWALWDEDRLSWHDRISHTHLTWNAAMAGGRTGDAALPQQSEGPQLDSASMNFEASPEQVRRRDSRH